MSDGLEQLAQRGRRTREIPPPRHPARIKPVQLAPVSDVPDEAELQVEPQLQQPSDNTKNSGPAALKVVTVYLEHSGDDFLENITHTGRTARAKLAVSRSAVVRLALERLEEQMTADAIVEELRTRGDQQVTGRKRR